MKTYILTSCFLLFYTLNTLRAQVPNDPYYPYQFYLQTINVEDAWDITKVDLSVIVTITDDPLDSIKYMIKA